MTDRIERFFKTVGLALGCWAAIFALAVVMVGCDAAGPTRPDPVTKAPEPVVAAPAPAPSATPGAAPVADNPAAFELSCLSDSTLTVKYNGEASRAQVDTFYTSFDDQTTPFGKQSHVVARGDTVTRAFGQVCIQGDADQPGVKLIGGCFFDINGKPFKAVPGAPQIAECRNRCVPRLEESEEETGEWEPYEPEATETNGDEKCYRYERRLVIVWEVNTCTKAKRELRRYYKSRKIEIECPCVERNPEGVRDYLSPVWSGNVEQGACTYGPPQLTLDASTTGGSCHENGTQKWIEDYTCREDATGSINVCRSVACPCTPIDGSSDRTAENYCLDDPLGSESAEAAWLHVDLASFVKKVESGFTDGKKCWTTDAAYDTVLLKDGKGVCSPGQQMYKVFHNVAGGTKLCLTSEISHASVFKGKTCN